MLGKRALGVQDYWEIVKRRWFWLVSPVLLGAVAGWGLTKLVSPQFVSQTLVLIEQQKVPDDYVKPVVSTDLDARLASMKEEILSRSRLVPIIERYGLETGRGVLMDSRIETVRGKIRIKPIRSEMSHGGGLPGFFVSYTAADPHTAQNVCAEITTLFVNENLRTRAASAEGTTDFLKDQLAAAKAGLDEQDKRMADFQRRFSGELPTDTPANINVLASLNVQLQAGSDALSHLEQERGYAEMMLAQQAERSGVSLESGAGGAGASGSKEAKLAALEAEDAELRRRYTPGHPDVLALERNITEARRDLAGGGDGSKPGDSGGETRRRESPAVSQLRSQLRAAELAIASKRREQSELDSSIRAYQARVSAAPGVEEEYKVMTRDYETAEGFYKTLLDKKNQSKMAGDLERRQQGEQFAVLDPANLPDEPSFPKRRVFVGGGFAAGLAVALIVCALLELRNTVLRGDRDVLTLTGVPVLATLSVIPSVKVPGPTDEGDALKAEMEVYGWRQRRDA